MAAGTAEQTVDKGGVSVRIDMHGHDKPSRGIVACKFPGRAASENPENR